MRPIDERATLYAYTALMEAVLEGATDVRTIPADVVRLALELDDQGAPWGAARGGVPHTWGPRQEAVFGVPRSRTCRECGVRRDGLGRWYGDDGQRTEGRPCRRLA